MKLVRLLRAAFCFIPVSRNQTPAFFDEMVSQQAENFEKEVAVLEIEVAKIEELAGEAGRGEWNLNAGGVDFVLGISADRVLHKRA